MTPLHNTIAHEAKLCRKAFAGVEIGTVVQHCHHEKWLEILTEPAENRISYIESEKAPDERAERLRQFRPFAWKQADAAREQAEAAREQADAAWKQAEASPKMLKVHAEVCGCPWDAEHDIFGNKR